MQSTSTIVVRYQETDQMGIAHHSVYPVWFEVARTDYIKQFGLTYSEMERRGVMLPLRDLTARYKSAAFYEDELLVTASLTKLSAAKMQFFYTVTRKSDGVSIAEGATTHGIVDSSTFRPINLKKAHPALYALFYEDVSPLPAEN